jgi:hypothetical protein
VTAKDDGREEERQEIGLEQKQEEKEGEDDGWSKTEPQDQSSICVSGGSLQTYGRGPPAGEGRRPGSAATCPA